MTDLFDLTMLLDLRSVLKGDDPNQIHERRARRASPYRLSHVAGGCILSVGLGAARVGSEMYFSSVRWIGVGEATFSSRTGT